MQGRFITFEGGEGSGKSTQIARLRDRLADDGLTVVLTREPGGAPSAEDVRQLLVTGGVDRWSPMAEVLLNYAARAMHVRETIRPALARGDWVLCDRFADSTMAYQGFAGGVERTRIRAIHQAVLDDFQPDLTMIFDLPVEVGLARAGKRMQMETASEDRFERKGQDYHQKLREGFLTIAEEEPARCRVVDANRDIDQIAEDVYDLVINTQKEG